MLIGNIQQAQKAFDKLSTPLAIPGAAIIDAELKAASGDVAGAQQAFLLAIDTGQLDEHSFSMDLIEYFCDQQKWLAIEAYGAQTLKANASSNLKNTQLTQIGLCYFQQQQWEKTQYWLSQLNFAQTIDPKVYLALAKANIALEQLKIAEEYIDKFEIYKTQVSAEMLWAAIEVYQVLGKLGRANQLSDNLRVLFPSWSYQYNHPINTAVKQNQPLMQPLPSDLPANNQSVSQHIIKKGETLYQLSKRYDVSIDDLLKWNQHVVVDDIPLGTSIRVSAK